MADVAVERFEDPLLAPEPDRRGNYVTLLLRLHLQVPLMIRSLLFAAVLALAVTSPAAAADAVFNPNVLHETQITMDPNDWRALRDNFRSDQYYAADVSFDGTVIRQAAIRSRGDGSRSEVKPALKVDFNRYVAGQQLRELKSLSLKNSVQDPSNMRERLSMAAFEAMGVPAPAVSFTRLVVNGEYWGLYNLVETIDKTFLQARFGEAGGNLYSYQHVGAYDFGYRGSSSSAYVPLPFEPETNEETGDRAALVELIRIANEAPAGELVAQLSQVLDVDRFITYLATENAIQEQDGFVGRQGANNFYLYQLKGQPRFTIIPWDKNTTLHTDRWPFDFNLGSNVLVRRLLQDPGIQRKYVEELKRAVSTFVNTRTMLPLLEAATAQIRSAALEDTKKPFTNAQFEDAATGLRGVIGSREADVMAQTSALGSTTPVQ